MQELREELKNLGLSQAGRKEELIKRLEDALSQNATATNATPATTASKAEPASKVIIRSDIARISKLQYC